MFTVAHVTGDPPVVQRPTRVTAGDHDGWSEDAAGHHKLRL
jgi:hypothetical protein